MWGCIWEGIEDTGKVAGERAGVGSREAQEWLWCVDVNTQAGRQGRSVRISSLINIIYCLALPCLSLSYQRSKVPARSYSACGTVALTP